MKKLLGIIVLGYIFLFNSTLSADEFANSKEYESNSFDWSYSNSNPYKISLKIRNTSVDRNNDQLYTRLNIFSNCDKNSSLKEIIDFKDLILKPYEVKNIDVTRKFEREENQCASLIYKKSNFFSLSGGDPCINEKNFISKSLCKAKHKEWDLFENDKISRGEAADKCSRKSKSQPSEVRSQYYKDCMKDEGY